jgi:hypothetical protein
VTDREVAQAKKLAIGMSESTGKAILADSRQYGAIEVLAAMIATGDRRGAAV